MDLRRLRSCVGCSHLRDGAVAELPHHVGCRYNEIDIDVNTRPYDDEGLARTYQRGEEEDRLVYVREDAAVRDWECGWRADPTAATVATRQEPEQLTPERAAALKRYARQRKAAIRASRKSPLILCPQGCGRKVRALGTRGNPITACPHCRRVAGKNGSEPRPGAAAASGRKRSKSRLKRG